MSMGLRNVFRGGFGGLHNRTYIGFGSASGTVAMFVSGQKRSVTPIPAEMSRFQPFWS
jgi:hypothetical protein